ncbi:MAG: HIT family protein [Candidatus Kaiserbacteria bacterium GW2011_GWC2_52_8b]|uniref:HIT family protein n=1 Tax=Candidatus Kaiserbacteria bacterium GW2011_GWC2_52_8b TaxID=1618676 RepID=A0A0G1ZQ61_9BACT|nr:MAG: HIT family protein [Candidatus Kaiserbacteria bacterium GW2011_GWC2_52_8b]
MKDCIFCKIIRGELPTNKVYEDDSTLAFLDIHPVTPGHTLVITKNTDSYNLLDISEAEISDLTGKSNRRRRHQYHDE